MSKASAGTVDVVGSAALAELRRIVGEEHVHR